jgi:hypothetical protein
VDIPGLTQTITVPAGGGVVFIATDGGFVSASSSAPAFIDLRLTINGSTPVGAVRRVCVEGTSSTLEPHGIWSLSRTLTLAAGSHTIKVQGASVSTQDATVSGNTSSAYNGALSVFLIRV